MKRKILMCLLSIVSGTVVFAQSSSLEQGLNSATSTLSSAFDSVATLVLIIGGLIGLICGVSCYSKFSGGDPDGGKRLAKWAGGIVFLSLVPTFLKAFFI